MLQTRSYWKDIGYWLVLAVFFISVFTLSASASSDDHSTDGRISVLVNASPGGTFTDNANNPSLFHPVRFRLMQN